MKAITFVICFMILISHKTTCSFHFIQQQINRKLSITLIFFSRKEAITVKFLTKYTLLLNDMLKKRDGESTLSKMC